MSCDKCGGSQLEVYYQGSGYYCVRCLVEKLDECQAKYVELSKAAEGLKEAGGLALETMNADRINTFHKLSVEQNARFGPNAGSVLQDWVLPLPLRYQGVLVSSIRGCDSVPKNDPSKAVIRGYRSFVLNTPSKKPSSFIEFVSPATMRNRFFAMVKDVDHLPHHFVMHLIHASQIVAYEHPNEGIRQAFEQCYAGACRRLHLHIETKSQLVIRLTAVESEFAKGQ